MPSDSDTHIQVVDFFSGCGGMSYGFSNTATQRIHFDIRGAIDTDPHANATYHRMLGIEPLAQDVNELTDPTSLTQAVQGWGLDFNQPLLLIGCAPCQGFSSHRKKDSRFDPRNSLLQSFGRVVEQLRPDVVVMENVPEIFSEQHWAHYQAWRETMQRAGYRVRAQIHNLAQFGVPQERFRALVVASKNWRYFAMPRPTHPPDRFVTVRQAIGHLRPLEAGGADPVDSMHVTSRHRRETVKLLQMIPPDGGSRKSLPDGVGPNCLTKVDGFRDVYGRLWWDRPAVAITARCRTPSCGRFTHPEQHRGLSVREAALLQGFPESFGFEGPFDDKFKQVGNAVSPIFSQAVATHLAHEWFANHDDPVRDADSIADITEPISKSFSSSIAAIKRRLRMSGAQEQLRLW